MEKTPDYVPSTKEMDKAKKMASDIEWEEKKKIIDLCNEIRKPLEQIKAMLEGREQHTRDGLIAQSRQYALIDCQNIEKALRGIEESK